MGWVWFSFVYKAFTIVKTFEGITRFFFFLIIAVANWCILIAFVTLQEMTEDKIQSNV